MIFDVDRLKYSYVILYTNLCFVLVAGLASGSSSSSGSSGSSSSTATAPKITFINVNGQLPNTNLVLEKPGVEMSLKCSGTGDPLPTISWSFTDIYSSTGNLDSNLKVENFNTTTGNVISRANATAVVPGQSGTYTCTVSGSGTTVTSTIEVSIYCGENLSKDN